MLESATIIVKYSLTMKYYKRSMLLQSGCKFHKNNSYPHCETKHG